MTLFYIFWRPTWGAEEFKLTTKLDFQISENSDLMQKHLFLLWYLHFKGLWREEKIEFEITSRQLNESNPASYAIFVLIADASLGCISKNDDSIIICSADWTEPIRREFLSSIFKLHLRSASNSYK